MPFITEHIFQEYYILGKENLSIHKLIFSKNNTQIIDTYFHLIIDIIELMRKAKSEQAMSLKTKINLLTINTNNKAFFSYLEINESIKNIIMIISNASYINYYYKETKNSELKFLWHNENSNNTDADLHVFI